MMFIRFMAVVAVCSLAFATPPPSPTFHKDVLPILQKRCQECHRPGEAAPFSLLTYKDARPWAKSIREAVSSKKMPPWFADPHYGKFANDRSLSQQEADTLVAWADGGAKAGNAKQAPAPLNFVEGWTIGKPDAIIELPMDFPVPASGTIEYTYFIMPANFKEDKWIELAEARPGDRSVVHHIIAFVREPGSKWFADQKPGVPFVPKRAERRQSENANAATNAPRNPEAEGAPGAELLAGYAPGLPASRLLPGQAKLVKAGSDLVFQMHYTSSGKAATDRSRVGLVFAKEPPKERVITVAASNGRFVIPPGAPNHEVESQITFSGDVKLVNLMPHMHLRGKDFEYRAVYPDGTREVLLKVPNYDFNWQLYYYLADQKKLPAGTRIECTAHFDNSPGNKANPDPKAEVRFGDQSWEEMMIGWFDIAIPAHQSLRDVMPRRTAQPRTSGAGGQ